MSKNQLDTFSNHMEFIGYTFEPIPDEENSLLGKHDKYGHVFVSNNGVSTIIKAFFNVGSNGVKKKAQYLELVNELNKKSSMSSFIAYDDILLLVTMYIGPYDKKEFGAFLDGWHNDNYLVFEQDDIDQFIE